MMRGILVFGVAVLGLAGCSATSSTRPETSASSWSEWESAEVTTQPADAATLSAGDPMGVALYRREAPVVSLPVD